MFPAEMVAKGAQCKLPPSPTPSLSPSPRSLSPGRSHLTSTFRSSTRDPCPDRDSDLDPRPAGPVPSHAVQPQTWDAAPSAGTLLVLGGEGEGVPAQAWECLPGDAVRVSIPIANDTLESFNVSTAASILMYTLKYG